MTTPSYRLPRGGTNSAAGIWIGLVGITLLTAIGASWMATQYTAHTLNYHPNLGPARVWKLYDPWMVWVWGWQYWDIEAYRPLWHTCLHILAVTHLAGGFAVLAAIWRGKRLGGETDLHGSAHWARERDVRALTQATSAHSVIIGKKGDRLLYDNGQGHVLTLAPTRSGKGVGIVVPTLLSWTGSVIINDIKGENFTLTAGYRETVLKQRILRFDPTASDHTSARYNPLLAVRAWPLDVKDVQLVVEQLTDPHGKGVDNHWNRTARDLLMGVILHQLYAGNDKSLAGCLRVLTDPRRPIVETLQAMLNTDHDQGRGFDWTEPETSTRTLTHPVIAGAVKATLNRHNDERDSVISTAIGFLGLYRDPLISENTSVSDFDLLDLVTQPTSLYFTTPIADLERTRPLARLLLHQAVQRLTEQLPTPERVPLLLMIDEFPTMGALSFFSEGLAWMAGYKMRACLVAQDLGQIENVYGRNKAILANCNTWIAFAPTLPETAKVLSERLGARTVTREVRTYSGGRLAMWLPHVIATEQESRRELLTADECMRLPETIALVFQTGKSSMLVEKLRYYTHPELHRRANIPAPTVTRTTHHRPSYWEVSRAPLATPTHDVTPSATTAIDLL